MMSAVTVLRCSMPRSTRLFEIIQLLRQATQPLTAQDIAGALEVTKRTVYRDMAALQAMRLPILGEAGVGYVLRAGFDLPPLMFTQDELEAIVVGLALLGRTGDAGLEQSAKNVAAKIAEVLPKGARDPAPLHVSRWNIVPTSSIAPSLLRRYIREDAELLISYTRQDGDQSQRRIKPLALVYYIDAVLLAAWCELRQTFRHFRIDRITECTPTGDCFSAQSDSLVKRWEQENALP
jgi:predicted DNA-binding transcriptional regulator YafY